MKCPMCEGEFDSITVRTAGGDVRRARRCTQCSGFWFERGTDEGLSVASVSELDAPQPNYSLKTFNLQCPSDDTLLEQSDHGDGPTGFRRWHCPDCRGTFYPRGQLALFVNWMAENGVAFGAATRPQAALAVVLTLLGGAATFASLTSDGFQAAVAEPLPTGGPNILTLLLIVFAYIAGTVLAVLGRRLPIVFMGWSVIAICLFGFFVIIFGP